MKAAAASDHSIARVSDGPAPISMLWNSAGVEAAGTLTIVGRVRFVDGITNDGVAECSVGYLVMESISSVNAVATTRKNSTCLRT